MSTPYKAHHDSALDQWHEGLCGCFDDCESCCCSFWCPCIQFGKNMEASGLGDCFTCGGAWFVLQFFTGLACILSFIKRTELRKAYGIHGSELEDCCIHTWCLCCALSQEAREIHRRGRPAGHSHQGPVQTVYVPVAVQPVNSYPPQPGYYPPQQGHY